MNRAKQQFENIIEGDSLGSFEITITRTSIVKYVGASGDFQPVHHDEAYAKSIGLPSVFANGLVHGGMLSRIVTDWAGDGALKRYKLRFTGMVWPADTLTFSGTVARKYREGDDYLADCALSVINQKGERVIIGEATVFLSD